jgi:hypothetical protein
MLSSPPTTFFLRKLLYHAAPTLSILFAKVFPRFPEKILRFEKKIAIM